MPWWKSHLKSYFLFILIEKTFELFNIIVYRDFRPKISKFKWFSSISSFVKIKHNLKRDKNYTSYSIQKFLKKVFRIAPYGHFNLKHLDQISRVPEISRTSIKVLRTRTGSNFLSADQITLMWRNFKWWTKMTQTKVIFKVNIPFMTGMIDRIDVFKILFSILNTKIIHSVIKLCFQTLIMVSMIFDGIQ